MANTLPDTALRYLHQLERATVDLPASVRSDILTEIRQELQAVPPGDLDAHISTLGDPYMISEAARVELESAYVESNPRRESATYTTVVAVVIFVGGVLVPIIGWIVGVVFLWRSRTWTTRDKVIGTTLPPTGGLASAVILSMPIFGTLEDIPGGIDLASDSPMLFALLMVVAALPLVTFVYLLLRARRLRSVMTEISD